MELEIGIFKVRQSAGIGTSTALLQLPVSRLRLDELAIDLKLDEIAPRQFKIELKLRIRHDLCLDKHTSLKIPERHAPTELKTLPLFGDLKVNEGIFSLSAISALPAPDCKRTKGEAFDFPLELEAFTTDPAVNLDLFVKNEGFALHDEARGVNLCADDAAERTSVDVDVLETNDLAVGLVDV